MRRIQILMLVVLVAALQSSYGCRSGSAPEPKAVSFASNNSQGQTANNNQSPPLPQPTGFVNDFAGLLDQAANDRLEKTLTEFKNSTGIEFAVVTVRTTGSSSAFDYSLALMREWGVGSPAHGGLLMLIVTDDKRWHIQISRRIEKVLTNEEVGQFGSTMKPFFMERKYAEGIEKCVDLFIRELNARHAS